VVYDPKTRSDDDFMFHDRPIKYGLIVTMTEIPKGDPRERSNWLRVRGWGTSPSGRRVIITDRISSHDPEDQRLWETRPVEGLRPV
jgi:hypothetical protein